MNLATLLKYQQIISIRDFIHNLSQITKQPTSKIYTVVKNGKKVGTYVPEQFEHEVFMEAFPMGERKYKSFFDDFDKLSFSTDDPYLSQKVDEVVYGDKSVSPN
jgi:hypothetical protein